MRSVYMVGDAEYDSQVYLLSDEREASDLAAWLKTTMSAVPLDMNLVRCYDAEGWISFAINKETGRARILETGTVRTTRTIYTGGEGQGVIIGAVRDTAKNIEISIDMVEYVKADSDIKDVESLVTNVLDGLMNIVVRRIDRYTWNVDELEEELNRFEESAFKTYRVEG